MSGVVNVWFYTGGGERLWWWTSDFTLGVVNVWVVNVLQSFLSGVSGNSLLPYKFLRNSQEFIRQKGISAHPWVQVCIIILYYKEWIQWHYNEYAPTPSALSKRGLSIYPDHDQGMVKENVPFKTLQELRMLSSVTANCQVAKIVINPGSQLSVL